MRLFECQNCGQLLYFENTRCEHCGHSLGYLSGLATLTALTPLGGDRWLPMADTASAAFRYCANAGKNACNWLVPADGPEAFCRSCRLNRTIPNLDTPRNLGLWRLMEAAKRRLVYGLLRLDLPVVSMTDDPQTGLAFDFLAGSQMMYHEGPPVTTGHDEGLITIDIAEADDVERERQRRRMGEPYRTLLGHFRHEVGHHYWERLVCGTGWLDGFRAVFDDERLDYGAALAVHYADGPPPAWQQYYVSGYAASHPWEDFAETWAHYLHIVDTLETAEAFGLQVHPRVGRDPALQMRIDFDPYRPQDFEALIAAWLPLTYAVNSLNQSMGQPDLYPFVLAPRVIDKLRFVHDLIQRNR